MTKKEEKKLVDEILGDYERRLTPEQQAELKRDMKEFKGWDNQLPAPDSVERRMRFLVTAMALIEKPAKCKCCEKPLTLREILIESWQLQPEIGSLYTVQ